MSTQTLKAMEQIGKPCHKYTGLTTALRTGALVVGTGYAFSTLWAMRSRNQALQKAEEDEFKYLVHEIRANNAARAPHAHKHHADIFNKIFVASFMLMIIPPSSSAGEIDWDKPETIEAAIESLNNQK